MEESIFHKQLYSLPNTPGVYLFFDTHKKLIYVGKATSLRSRVQSYFRGARSNRPIEQMMHEVKDIQWIETESVLEAVILEANTIKQKNPKYNVIGKDNKSWNYICITKDEYPRIVTLRQHEMKQYLDEKNKQIKNWTIPYSKEYELVFGPYPGLNTEATMKLLRKLFHYSDCKPHSGKPCLYRQMGICRGVCTGEISSSEYVKKVIRPLVSFLKGNKKKVIADFEKEMKKASKEERFEDATVLRNQIARLERIQDIALLNKDFFSYELESFKDPYSRIEAYDISNLGETGKVGSMVVFEDGNPKKKEYRKFKIKTVIGQSDVDCLEEVLERRLKHDEWMYPNLFLIDGGKPQVNRAKKILMKYGIELPVIGIAKGPERKKNEFVFAHPESDIIQWVSTHEDILIRARDEAHRFAIQYQRSLRKIKK
ncbi:MAG: GIY-YIG nuclease family protein [Candidatus Magasanikbacteria bacterium]